MNRSPLRLVLKRWKALYVVGGFFVTFGIFRVINFLPNELVTATLTTVVQVAWIYYATRIFRGEEELLVSPRPWWRVTARPRAGFTLAALWVISAAGSLYSIFTSDRYVITYASSVIEFTALTALYLYSSIRLLRLATHHATT